MEDVLDLYEEEYDRKSPTVCLDEKPVVLHADVPPPIPVEPGRPEREDYEYERKGTRNLFMMVEPLACWQHVEARRILQRLGFHYTSKHGSWLNMAEIEIAILERNTLSRRLESEAALRRHVEAVETEHNANRRGTVWQFTSRDARCKLERLYPVKETSSN